MPFYGSYSGRTVSVLGNYLNRRFADFIVSAVGRWCPPGEQIIEIGPGDGRVARKLAGNYRYTGYEPAPDSARALRESNINIKESFVPPLSEADGSQGAVIAGHVLEHSTDHRAAYALCGEMFRVLKPGGIAVIVCPDARDLRMLFYDVDYSHGYITTPARVVQMLGDCGFVVQERGMLYGSLPALPGLICNWLVRVFFSLLGFVLRRFCLSRSGFLKAENLFSQAFWVVVQKTV